jgi:6-phosphogluconolactonase
VNGLEILEDAEAVARAAAADIADTIGRVLVDNEYCHIALPGGGTPARCLELLSAMRLPWSRLHWYLGDERCYPPGHAERNDTMIRDRLWSRIDGPENNNHPIAAELGAVPGAEAYAALISSIGHLDLVVLGMGEDGHTASLFPGNAALQDTRAAVPVYDSPKPPPERVSLGLETLRSAGRCIVIATGSGKQDALQRVNRGEALPVLMAQPDRWLVDTLAAAELSPHPVH